MIRIYDLFHHKLCVDWQGIVAVESHAIDLFKSRNLDIVRLVFLQRLSAKSLSDFFLLIGHVRLVSFHKRDHLK